MLLINIEIYDNGKTDTVQMLNETVISRCCIVREADKTRRCTGVIVHRCRNIRDPLPGRNVLRSEQGNEL